MAGDRVWIRGTAEISVSGIDPADAWISVAADEWNQMDYVARQSVIDEAADAALEMLSVSFGAGVVDASEVPQSELDAAGGES